MEGSRELGKSERTDGQTGKSVLIGFRHCCLVPINNAGRYCCFSSPARDDLRASERARPFFALSVVPRVYSTSPTLSKQAHNALVWKALFPPYPPYLPSYACVRVLMSSYPTPRRRRRSDCFLIRGRTTSSLLPSFLPSFRQCSISSQTDGRDASTSLARVSQSTNEGHLSN